MSGFMHWFVIVGTVAFLIATLWLIRWSEKQAPDELTDSDTMGHTWDGDLVELNNPLPRWWLILFYLTIVFAVAYLVLFPGLGRFSGTLGWTQNNRWENEVAQAEERYAPLYARYGAQEAVSLIGDANAMKLGRSLYANYCSTCHGSDARGGPGFPNLTDNDWLYGGSPAVIEASIVNGRNGVMPPLGSAFDEAGVRSLARTVQGLGSAPAGNVGDEKYQSLCSACHGADGRGNQALGAPNLRDDIWLHGGSIESIRQTIVAGRNNGMPAHGNLLGPHRARILAAYIYSLSSASQSTAATAMP